MKKLIAFVLASVICLCFAACDSGTAAPTESTTAKKPVVTAATVKKISEDEKFVAEWCMAYMKHLKDPYSFELKKAWADNLGNGDYKVFVRFTAANGFGGTITKELASMGTTNRDELKKFDPAIHTWGSITDYELKQGEYLDTAMIQEYIDNNY